MDIAQIRTFLAAAETGSFLAAAALVNASASSVTERIAALEARLGARLFDRSRKGCSLTSAGAAFIPRAESIAVLWDVSRAEARIPPQFTSHARIGGQYSLWPSFLIEWTENLQQEMPHQALTLTAGSSERLDRELGQGKIDLAILYRPQLGPLSDAREIFTDRLVLVRSVRLKDWRKAWVDIDWGEKLRVPIIEAVGGDVQQGVRLDFGGMAVRWLEGCAAAGYVPERLARDALMRGSLQRVAGMPAFEYPIRAAWLRSQKQVIEPLIQSLQTFLAATAMPQSGT